MHRLSLKERKMARHQNPGPDDNNNNNNNNDTLIHGTFSAIHMFSFLAYEYGLVVHSNVKVCYGKLEYPYFCGSGKCNTGGYSGRNNKKKAGKAMLILILCVRPNSQFETIWDPNAEIRHSYRPFAALPSTSVAAPGVRWNYIVIANVITSCYLYS